MNSSLRMTGARAVRENPFTPHSAVAPGLFVGRTREIGILIGHITSLQRGNVAISGALGSGKTSLLRHVATPGVMASHGASPSRPAVIYLDSHSVAPFSVTNFWRRIARLAMRSGVEAISQPAANLLDSGEVDVYIVEEFLDDIANRSAAVALFLDEFEWVLQDSGGESARASRNFLAQLASLARRAPRVFSLIVSTEERLTDVFQSVEAWRGSPFPTVFTSLRLGPLDSEACQRLLSVASTFGVEFTALERELAIRRSAGQPALLQAAAFAMFSARVNGLGALELERMVDLAVKEIETTHDAAMPAAPPPHEPPALSAESSSSSGHPSGLWIDAESGEVQVDGRRMEPLTALEFNLLKLLYDNPGRLCSKSEIIEQVWGSNATDEIDVSRVEKLVSRLRRKIEPIPGKPQHVRTVRGRGYRYVPA